MKKQIIASLGISLAIIGGSFATAAINNANAEVSASKSGNFSMESLAFNESTTALATDSIKIASKYETVYAVTDHSGLIEQSYIGNTINTSSTALPLKLDIKYYLDGVEVSGNSLANKSGHVRINYSYSSTEVYQDKLVPFVVITGLTLDENIKDNRKDIPLYEIIDSGINIERDLIKKEKINLLNTIIAILEPKDRFMLEHYFCLFGKEKMTQKKIAEVLGVKDRYVTYRIKRAMRIIKKIMEDKYEKEN